MPIYIYQCSICGHKLEIQESISASGENKPCPKCQETLMQCGKSWDCAGNCDRCIGVLKRQVGTGIIGIVKGSKYPCH